MGEVTSFAVCNSREFIFNSKLSYSASHILMGKLDFAFARGSRIKRDLRLKISSTGRRRVGINLVLVLSLSKTSYYNLCPEVHHQHHYHRKCALAAVVSSSSLFPLIRWYHPWPRCTFPSILRIGDAESARKKFHLLRMEKLVTLPSQSSSASVGWKMKIFISTVVFFFRVFHFQRFSYHHPG